MFKTVIMLILVLAFSSIRAEEPAESGTMPVNEKLLGRIKCRCDCDMTLDVCEKDDPYCAVRPLLVRRMEKLIQDEVAEEKIIESVEQEEISPARKAICRAGRENRFLFLFFYEKGSDKSDRMAKVIEEARGRFNDRVDVVKIDINDGREIDIIREYRIWQAPITLVMAPNGIITAGSDESVTLEELEQALISPTTVKVIGALQQHRVIFLLVQNKDTAYSKENLKTVHDVADILRKSVRVIEVDPRDKEEESFLRQIEVKPHISHSITLVISPTGGIGDRFKGKVTNKDLFASFKKVIAQKSGCGSGCGGGK